MWEAIVQAYTAYENGKDKGGGGSADAGFPPSHLLTTSFNEAPWIVATGGSKLSAGNTSRNSALPLVMGAATLGLLSIIGLALWKR